MTLDDLQNNIGNAQAIVERFGGIRPMAAKTGMKVTTIQGWKQRGSIPASRKDELLAAARAHGIRIEDLLENVAGAGDAPFVEQAAQETREYSVELDGQSDTPRARVKEAENIARGTGTGTTFLIAGVLLLAAAVIGTLFAIAPDVRKMTDQEQKIAALQAEVDAMKQAREEAVSARHAEAYDSDVLTALQNQVGEIAAQNQEYSAVIANLKGELQSGGVQQRLESVEGQLKSVMSQARATGLDDVVNRVSALARSPEGGAQVEKMIGALLQSASQSEPAAAQGGEQTAGATGPDSFSVAFETLRQTDPAVAETFRDVAPEDVKAAVMLVGLAQLRDSLARDRDSFDQDLALLKQTAAKDDPELSAAIDRLAPKAREGVLTPEGLSHEFKSMTGDIVSASLAGENVSVEEKAMARLGNLVKVEKSGERISGTETQKKVADAQARLDRGDIEGAVAILQQINGPAAQKTESFISQAQATILAQRVQNMLQQNIALKIKNGIAGTVRGMQGGTSGGYMATGSGLALPDVHSIVPDAPVPPGPATHEGGAR